MNSGQFQFVREQSTKLDQRIWANLNDIRYSIRGKGPQ